MLIPTKMMFILLLADFTLQKCSFQIGADGVPVKSDREPFLVQDMSLCVEYNGQLGCCDNGNDVQQINSYVSIDGIFGSSGDGCDICAINLKRFWCEYACSPNQADFMDVKDGLWPIPNPQNPQEILMVQKLDLRVHSDTACDLYNSCNRNSFVSTVSAMSTPAGFLTFQGHNAANQALQDMSITFSLLQNNSLYFGSNNTQESGKELQNCNYTSPPSTIHGFPFFKNCTCNNCASACQDKAGFQYTELPILEDINYVLIGVIWIISIIVAALVQKYRGN